MKRSFAHLVGLTLFTFACTPPGSDDDEAGVTTVMGESDSDTVQDSSTDEDTSSTSDSMFVEPSLDIGADLCSVWAQDCPDGEKCVPFDSSGSNVWDAYKCVPVMGSQQAGDPCWYGGLVEATDDCDASSFCFDTMEVDGQQVGTCFTQCTGTPDEPMCPVESTCAISGAGVLSLCIPTCDPLVQDCGDGDGCYWTVDNFNCVVTTLDIPTGEPCGFINDCAPGNLCTDTAVLPECEDAACCTSYCDLQLGDAECAAQPGTACVAFFEQGMVPSEYANVGVCVLPP